MAEQPFNFPSPAESPGFLLWRTTSSWQRAIQEALRPFDLTQPQFVLLATSAWLASQGENATQAAISELSGTDPNTVSATIKRLETKALLIRRAGVEDRRTRVVSLTEMGGALLAEAAPAVEAADANFFADSNNAAQLASLARISKGLTGRS